MDTFINAFEEELEAQIESKSAVHNPILSCPILSYPILSYPTLPYPTLSYPILPYPILFSLLFCPRRHAGLVEQPSELEVVEMLQVINWLEYYQEQMRVFVYDESSVPLHY